MTSNLDVRDPRVLDRLVDGELTDEQEREILLQLERDPSGWRRCALAFLEAQAFRQEFGSMLSVPTERPVSRRPAQRYRWGGYGGTLLAMAASFLVALFVGTQLPGPWRRPAPADPSPNYLAEGTSNGQQPVARPERPAEIPLEVPRQPQTPSAPVWMVELAGPDGESEPIRVPAVERDSIDEDWLQNLPAAIPPEVVRQWERIGHPIRQRRRLLPFRLNDGRQLVVPVDEVNLPYVGRPAL